MKYIKLISLFALIGLTIWAFFPRQPLVQTSDYEIYLSPEWLAEEVARMDTQIDFWQKKLDAAPRNQVYLQKMAGLYAAKFKATGEISFLHQSDSLYEDLTARFPANVGVLHALTANAISQHQFKAAEGYVNQAWEVGEKKFASSLLMTDVALERGDYNLAWEKLNEISTRQHFDYFIRAVKWQDQSGNLDKAVDYMERALALAKTSKKKTLINWSLSNLADMYGHQGEIKQSYDTYLEALAQNPSDMHSLKGIAWIAYSHEKNTEEAKRILHFLQEVHPVPDYDLMLSEIAAFEGDDKRAAAHLAKFVAAASRPAYGKMYHTYLSPIYGEEMDDVALALEMAEAEVAERPHPMSYSLLSWAYHLKGDSKKALEVLTDHVIGQTEEPDAILRAGILFHANGMAKEAQKYLLEAQDAAFELGPMASQEIADYLRMPMARK